MKKQLMMVIVASLTIVARIDVVAQEHKTRMTSEGLNAYSKLSLSGALNVEWILADSDAVELSIHNDDLPYLKCTLEADALIIALRPKSNKSKTDQRRGEVKIYSSHPIPSVKVMGSNLLMPHTYARSSRYITVGGGGKVTAEMDCTDLELNVSGNSAVSLSGKSKYLTVTATESSNVNCRNMHCTSIVAEANTNAELFIWGNERVVMRASSGGTIFYRGHPEVVKETIPSISFGASINNIKE